MPHAGVVNFVLKKDFTGTQITVGYGNTFDSAVGEKSLNVLAGGASGKFRGLISFDYFDRNELMNVDHKHHSTATSARAAAPMDARRPAIPAPS